MGKTDRVEGGLHHLAHHCADVAACFESIASLSTFRSHLEHVAGGPLSPVIIARLAVLAFLHDAGKLHPGFQTKGWPEGIYRGPRHGHVLEGAAIFCETGLQPIALHLCKADLIEWGTDLNLLFSVFAHHGRPFSPDSKAGKSWNVVETATVH